MLDLLALPIAVSLTLWDAAPVYFSICLAISVLAAAVLRPKSFHIVWRLREVAGLEGIVYLVLFQPILVPPLVAASALSIYQEYRTGPSSIEAPSSPLASLRVRSGEIFVALLFGSITAAVIKLGAPSIPTNLLVQILVALLAGIVVRRRSGAAAIPAVASAVHLGGIVPASVCILASAVPLGPLPMALLRRRSGTTS